MAPTSNDNAVATSSTSTLGATTPATAPATGAQRTVTAQSIVAATLAAPTLTARWVFHADPATEGTDHGSSGREPIDITTDLQIDFSLGRSVSSFELRTFEDSPTTNVEWRVVDGLEFIKDGSWLCPMCGFDEGEPWPEDKWIVMIADRSGRFGPRSELREIGLQWLELMAEPILATSLNPSGGVAEQGELASGTVTIPVSHINEQLPPTTDDYSSSEVLQGEEVAIEFVIDENDRLRSLVVRYQMDDRVTTSTVTFTGFGLPVEVEVPPKADQYDTRLAPPNS
jgi:hypothetical protein